MNKYILRPLPAFTRKYKKLVKENKSFQQVTGKTLKLLAQQPFSPKLRTHKVNTRNFGVKWSSRVTNDIRIIWGVEGKQIDVIYLFDVGGHSGKKISI